MSATDPAGAGGVGRGPMPPGALLDVLSVAALVLDATGRIVLWSPQAERLFGYTADEALGQDVSRLLVHEAHRELANSLLSQVMEGGSWAGVFPVRHRDGGTRLLEFRTMRLLDDHHKPYALGLATDQGTLRDVERDLALSPRLVSQSPIGFAVLDPELRYVSVNSALGRINGLSEAEHVGRHARELPPFRETEGIEALLCAVLRSGEPVVDQYAVGRTPADPDTERAWSVSFFRLEDPAGTVLGVAASVVDVTERHRAAMDAARARKRLALIADASGVIGSTLDLERTARELAEVSVPELADVAAVDVLDSVVDGRTAQGPRSGSAVFRALAIAASGPSEAVRVADHPGDVARYSTDRLVTECVNTARPVLVSTVTGEDTRRIARDEEAADVLAGVGLHSYLAVPLIARGEVLGALDLKRFGNPAPFEDVDVLLAWELAARAAVCIDNARLYQAQRHAALSLQRSLLPHPPPHAPGLDIACRYEPADAVSEIGGDWYDAIRLPDDKTALVVGDVMGSGLGAAATMGQLRTATRAYAEAGLDPAEVLHHLDHLTAGVDHTIATCLYAVYDPHTSQCRLALAGHLPPVLVRPGRRPQLLDLPTGAPLGIGDVRFHTTLSSLLPGDQLVLYTDGLVETRDEPIDRGLEALTALLDPPGRSLEDTCDRLLHSLRHRGDDDDVALLIARAGTA